MANSGLIGILGYRGAFLHGDPLMLDRWKYVSKWLPRTRDRVRVFDVGCGSGAFTIGAAKRGYDAVGLSWDERNQSVARHRAALCKVDAAFPIGDARNLGDSSSTRAHTTTFSVWRISNTS
jgi:2-polyprenyl-3-methyl-5-hydroxy-6-metoxy-1,4-benzoquinol methylase